MNTTTDILFVLTKREAIVFIYHIISKQKKQSFSASSVSANQVEEFLPRINIKRCPSL